MTILKHELRRSRVSWLIWTGAVGALLITALIVFPAQCGMRLFKSFRAVILSAAAISVCCAVAGILIAIVYSTPVGCTIVATELTAFLICVLIDFLKGGRKK